MRFIMLFVLGNLLFGFRGFPTSEYVHERTSEESRDERGDGTNDGKGNTEHRGGGDDGVDAGLRGGNED